MTAQGNGGAVFGSAIILLGLSECTEPLYKSHLFVLNPQLQTLPAMAIPLARLTMRNMDLKDMTSGFNSYSTLI